MLGLCCARCQHVGAQSLLCLSTPWEPPPRFVLAFQLPLTWILEALDLVTSTLEREIPECPRGNSSTMSGEDLASSSAFHQRGPFLLLSFSGGGEERALGDLSLYWLWPWSVKHSVDTG